MRAACAGLCMKRVSVLLYVAWARMHAVLVVPACTCFFRGGGPKMTPAMRTEICSPKGEGRLSAFTFLGTISRPEDGPFFGGALVEPSCKHVHVHVTIMHVACVTSLCLCTTFCRPVFVLVKAGIGCEVCLRHVPEGLRFVACVGGTAYAICCEPSAAGTCCARICGPLQFGLP